MNPFRSRVEYSRKKYRQLEQRYAELKHEYGLAQRKPEQFMEKSVQTFMVKGLAVAISFAILGYAIVRSMLMFEFAVIAFTVDLLWELYGTWRGMWKYRKSAIYDVLGRVPIEIPLGISLGSAFLIAFAMMLIGLF